MTVRIAIIGAGPAGITCSYVLSRLTSCEIYLIEQYRYPRDKPCGGGLTPKTIILLIVFYPYFL